MNKKQNLSQTRNICLICNEESIKRTFCWDCNICKECFGSYLITMYENSLIEIKDDIKCANHLCRNTLKLTDMIHLLKEDTKQILLKLLLNNYFSNKKDIVKCPKNNCDYSAFVQDEDRCCEEFSCNICLEKWKNNNRLNTYYNKDNIKEEITELIVHLTSVPCTNCSIRINKTTGCNHMKCVRCQTEFCYKCLKNYTDHLKETSECIKKTEIEAMYIFIFVVFSVLKLLLSFGPIRWLSELLLRFMMNFVLINVIFCLYAYIMFKLIVVVALPDQHRNIFYLLGRDLQIKISQYLFYIFLFTHIVLYSSNEFVEYYTNYFLKEILVLVGISICYSFPKYVSSLFRSGLR